MADYQEKYFIRYDLENDTGFVAETPVCGNGFTLKRIFARQFDTYRDALLEIQTGKYDVKPGMMFSIEKVYIKNGI